MAEEEPWSGWNRVEKQVQHIDHGDWKKPNCGITGEERDVREDFTNNEAIFRRCAFDFEEGQRVDLEYD